MSPPFNYKHLYYFWVVAKKGGISRAADKLDMAVQTVSAQVRQLERALGYAWVHDNLSTHYAVERLGHCEGVTEHFFAIVAEKKVQHPLVQRLLRPAI